jgi:hypothetical protein
MTEATSSIPNVAARRDILAELNSLLRRPDLWLTAGLDGLLTSQLGDAVRKLRKSPELTISVNRQILEAVLGPVIRGRFNAVRQI